MTNQSSYESYAFIPSLFLKKDFENYKKEGEKDVANVAKRKFQSDDD
jgi:hypothetical protein